MGTYFQRDTNRAVGWIASTEKALETTAGTSAATIGASVAANAVSQHIVDFTATTGQGTLNWTTTGYDVQLDVTAAGSSVTYNASAGRGTSDLSTFVSSVQLAASQSGTGLKLITPSIELTSLNTNEARSATDIYFVRINANNGNMMSAESLTLRVNTTDSYVTVPWATSAPTTAPTITTVINNATSQLLETSTVTGATTYEWEIGGVLDQNTSSLQLVNRPLTPGTQYSYRVRGVNSVGAGPWSSTHNVTTPVPTLPLLNAAEGGVEDTSLVGSGTNLARTGGASGHAFDSWSSGTGVVVAFDNERVRPNSTRSIKFETPSTGAAALLIWRESMTGRPLDKVSGRAYMNFGGFVDQRLLLVRNSSESDQGGFGIYSSRRVVLRDTSGLPIATSRLILPSTAQWIRFEWLFIHSAGFRELRIYLDPEADASEPDDVMQAYQAFTGTGFSRVDIGLNVAGSPAIWMDDIGLGTNWLGPTQPRSGSNPTANAGVDQVAVDNQVVTLSASGGTSYAWRQIDGPTVTLNNPLTATPTFTYDDDATYRSQPR